MNKIVLVDREEELEKLVTYLLNGHFSEIALDTEGESFLHRYGMHLCLIQLFDGERCYLVDPIKIENISCLKPLFEGNITKVIYHANNDLILLDYLYNYHMKNIFDISIAAQVLKLKPLSIPTLLHNQLGVALVKSKSKQKANWTRRPLRNDLIEYATNDVKYLLLLKAKLMKHLKNRNLLKEADQKNRALENVRYQLKIDPHLSIKKAKGLSNDEQIYLEAFYKARDCIAKELDYPPNNVVKNDDLIAISKEPPQNKEKWLSIIGNPKSRISKYIHLLQNAKEEADHTLLTQ
jgi:ribonuclease D